MTARFATSQHPGTTIPRSFSTRMSRLKLICIHNTSVDATAAIPFVGTVAVYRAARLPMEFNQKTAALDFVGAILACRFVARVYILFQCDS